MIWPILEHVEGHRNFEPKSARFGLTNLDVLIYIYSLLKGKNLC